MTRSLLGLVGLNLLFLVAGCGVLWAARGWRAWTELVRLGGLAYLVGVAAVGVLATEVLIAGGDVSVPVVVALALGGAVAGTAVGVARRRPRPALRLAEERREPFLLVGVVCAALTLVLLAASFRAMRLQGLFAYDAWAFWTPKALTIHYFGGLDRDLFAALPGPAYPIFVPALQATAFEFMGSPDTTTLHVQYWLLLVGFVFSLASLLRPRVPLAVLWPFLALALAAPDIRLRIFQPQADLPLDYFFAVAALSAALWLLDRQDWLLVPYGVCLAAALATKREGQLLALVLVAAALLASRRSWRRAWPRFLGVAAAAFVFSLPWRIWLAAHGVGGEWEDASLRGMIENLDRVPPALRVTAEILFDYHLWLLAVPLGVVAAALAYARGREPIAVLYLGTLVLGYAGMVWISWAFLRLPIDASDQSPVPRVIGALTLLSVAFAPILLARALRRE